MAKKQDYILGAILLAVFALFVVFFMVMMFGLSNQPEMTLSGGGDKIAVVELNGVIMTPTDIVRQFRRFQKDATVKAIVLRINSPGGGVAPSQEIYEHVRRVRDSGKPVVASMGTVAASGGYYVALGSSVIMANPATTTGSIGVIAEFPNFGKLLDKVGVDMVVIKSGKFKDTGTPYRGLRPDEVQYLQGWIDDAFDQFVDTVVKERELSRDKVLQLADGRVYTGIQARNEALIDTLGTYYDAIKLAAEMGGIKGEPKILRERQRKITIFDILSEDVRTVLSNFVSLWPEAKYQMKF